MSTRKLAYAVLLGMIGLIAVGCARSAPPEGQARVPAETSPVRARLVTVAFVEGGVTVNGAAVEPGDVLPSKFVAKTEGGARLDIVFDERNVLSVGQNALVEFDLSSVVPLVALERGGLASVLKKLEKIATTDSFNVQTAQAVMGVRGTSFCVWADASSTYVCACNGEVHTVDARGGNEETLAAAHHVARLYAPKDGAISVEAAGMLHHTDEGIESVASRIGYTIDWTKIDR